MSAAVDRLAALAVSHGWTPRVFEGDGGTVLHLQRAGKVLIALWEQNRWRSGFAVWRADAGVMGARRFAALLAETGDLDAALDQIGAETREVRAEREQATREKAAQKRAAKTAEAEKAARRAG